MNISKLKDRLETLKSSIKDEEQKKLIDTLVEELDTVPGKSPEGPASIKKTWAYRATDIISRISIALLKHELAATVLKHIRDILK